MGENRPTRLAIVGASARAAASSARSAGFEVVAADLFADWDLTNWAETTRIADWPDGFASWLSQQQVDGWLYTGGLENFPELVDRMAAIRPCWGNRGSRLRDVRSPERLAAALASAGCCYPTISMSHVNASPTRRWLVKSCFSAGGLGVGMWDGATPLVEGTYLQEWIEGRSVSAVYVAAKGKGELLGATEQLIGRCWTRSGEFQYAGSIGPVSLTSGQRRAAERAGECLAHEFDLVGLFGIDFVVDSGGQLWVVDVNPRYTASMELVERLRGENLVLAHATACRGEAFSNHADLPTGPPYIGKAYLFARQEATVSPPLHQRLREWAEAQQGADVPPPNSPLRAGDPVTTLFAHAGSPEEVEQLLAHRAHEIEAELYP